MKVGFLRPSIEKDFEFFVRNLPKLEAVEFCGIAKILSVPLYKQIGMETIDPKELKEMIDICADSYVYAIDSFMKEDKQLALKVIENETKADDMEINLRAKHI